MSARRGGELHPTKSERERPRYLTSRVYVVTWTFLGSLRPPLPGIRRLSDASPGGSSSNDLRPPGALGLAIAVDCLPRPDQWWLEAPVMTHPPVSLRSS
jgi:hypothetical protein